MDTAFLQPSQNVEDHSGGIPWLNQLDAILTTLYVDEPLRSIGLKDRKKGMYAGGQSYSPAENLPFKSSLDKIAKNPDHVPWAFDYPAQYAHAKGLWANTERGSDMFGSWVGKENPDRTRPWAMRGRPIENEGAFQWLR